MVGVGVSDNIIFRHALHASDVASGGCDQCTRPVGVVAGGKEVDSG